MKTIKNEVTSELEIKNSRFISYLFPIENDQIDDILLSLKREHPKATHICYAYIYQNIFHYSDDNEPSNTAGLPLYMVLEKNHLNRVLIAVVRYFGGIKLGAGGLVRAYTKAATTCLEKATLISLEEGYQVKIKTSYEEVNNLLYLLRNYQIKDTNYQEDITIIAEIPKEDISILHSYSYEILENILITKNSN